MLWMLFALLFGHYFPLAEADRIADILKFIYKNENYCGDPFADPQWLPAYKECTISCDIYSQICMFYADRSYPSQKCVPLPEICSTAIKEHFHIEIDTRTVDGSDMFTSRFRLSPHISNSVQGEHAQSKSFTTMSGMFPMQMFRIARAKPAPETTTLRPIVIPLFKKQRRIFERVHPPAFAPFPPKAVPLQELEYIQYEDNNAVTAIPVTRTTTAYHPQYSFTTESNVLVDDDVYSSQQATPTLPQPVVTEKEPFARGTLPNDLNYNQAPASGYAEEYDSYDDKRNFDVSDMVQSPIPPSPTRTISPPAPPQPPAIAPTDYDQAQIVESETNNFLNRALSHSATTKYGRTDDPAVLQSEDGRTLQYFTHDKQSTVRDYSTKCCEWALNGFCDRSWQKIRHICPKSCGTIICSTTDNIQSCNRAIDVEAVDCFDPMRPRAHTLTNVGMPKDQLLNSIATSTERRLWPADGSGGEYRRAPQRGTPRVLLNINRVDELANSPKSSFVNTQTAQRKPSYDVKATTKIYPVGDRYGKMKPYVVEDEMRSWSQYKRA